MSGALPLLRNSQYTVKPVLSDHIKQDMFLAFQTGGCLLLHESTVPPVLSKRQGKIAKSLA